MLFTQGAVRVNKRGRTLLKKKKKKNRKEQNIRKKKRVLVPLGFPFDMPR